MKKTPGIHTFSQDVSTDKTNTSMNSSDWLLQLNEVPSQASKEESDASGSGVTKFYGKRELMESLIAKSGSELNPTYSCQVPGCLFSVRKSLLCIKGHILAEHGGAVS